jgi:TonB family protein
MAAPGRLSAVRDLTLPAWMAAADEVAMPIDVTTLDAVPPPIIAAVAPAEPAVETSAAILPGDQSTAAHNARASVSAGMSDRRAPAPDRGADDGRRLEQPAWRRDASTLRERAADGAERDQPAHTRTARTAASPQAVRREPVTGLGDSVRTQQAQAAPPAARYGVLDPEDDGLGGDTDPTGARDSDTMQRLPTPAAAHTIPASAQGPLDAETGTRNFDVERPSSVASDERVTRAASTAQHPSITDLTLASVSGNSSEGRGPSDIPGAVPRPTNGAAAAIPGTRSTVAGVDNTAATRERVYDRYYQEITARVGRALIWPRVLAIRLEQGETVLRFVVRPDGRLTGNAQVVKSSGFVEFDQAALEALRKALPFPPMSTAGSAAGQHGPLAVTLRVPFSNPAVR